jgi:hypothetical protein
VEFHATIWKLLLGSFVVLALIVLAVFIALGHVEEKTSFGLSMLIPIVGKFVLDFSEWAFRGHTLRDEMLLGSAKDATPTESGAATPAAPPPSS